MTHFGLITPPLKVVAVHSENDFFDVPVAFSKGDWKQANYLIVAQVFSIPIKLEFVVNR
jgi:hypothetical protein